MQGGKQSRSGVFEDDEQDVPIVRKISFVESPAKEKKKKHKKGKEKDEEEEKEKERVENEKLK